ncbi:MAG: acyltransferase family protein [Bacilli bacterium]
MIKRSKTIDCLKGLVIILMIIGHAIQYGSGNDFITNEFFFDNILFKFIYGFHMPIFMLISGYLFYYSAKGKNKKEIIIKKLKQLLIPILSWSIVIYLFNSHFHLSFNMQDLINYINCLFNYLWYLWAFLFSVGIVLLVEKFGRHRTLCYIFLLLLFLILPDNIHKTILWKNSIYLISMSLNCFKFTFFFFVAGYYFNKNKQLLLHQENKKELILSSILFMVSYIIMILFFKKEFYIYTSGFSILNKNIIFQLAINLYRFVTGILGCVSFLYIIKIILVNVKESNLLYKTICYIGTKTMGIYTISCCFFYSILYPLTKSLSFSYIHILLESIIILLICLYLTTSIEKSKTAKKIFLGEL